MLLCFENQTSFPGLKPRPVWYTILKGNYIKSIPKREVNFNNTKNLKVHSNSLVQKTATRGNVMMVSALLCIIPSGGYFEALKVNLPTLVQARLITFHERLKFQQHIKLFSCF